MANTYKITPETAKRAIGMIAHHNGDLMKAMHDVRIWVTAAVGCYWTRGEHSIATVRHGNEPGYYRLYWRHQQLGGRFCTLADAQQAAENHKP